MRIKLNENLGNRGKKILIQAGFEVSTVTDQDMCSAIDLDLINKCREENRILVSLDKDFSNPLLFNPSEYSGIIIIRLTANPEPEEIYNCIRLLAKGLQHNKIDGKLWIVQKKSIRIYQPEDELD